jgi:hypothetical protein
LFAKIPFLPSDKKLSCQPNSALGSAAVDDPSALLGGHPLAKAVVSGASDSTGLKGSFHGNILL